MSSSAQKPKPNKFKPSNFAQRIADLGEETLKKAANASGDAAGAALEQMGWGTLPGAGGPAVNYSAQAEAEAKREELARKETEAKARDNQQIMALKRELEAEIEKNRRMREEQLRRRREISPEEVLAQQQVSQRAGLPETASRPKQGLFAGLRARKRESQAELAGGRRSG